MIREELRSYLASGLLSTRLVTADENILSVLMRLRAVL